MSQPRQPLVVRPEMPKDPLVCRWCGGRRVRPVQGSMHTFCPNGCLNNNTEPVFVRDCMDCGQEWFTGRGDHPVQCPPCESGETQRLAAQERAEGHQVRGYEADMRKAGANRRAHATWKGDDF